MAYVWNVDVASVDTDGNLDTDGTITAGGAITAPSFVGSSTGQNFGTVSTYTTATPAIALTDKIATLDATTQGVAATLAAGTAGQIIYVKAINVDNAVTLTAASLVDGTTITFTPVNEYIVLASDGTNWLVVGGNAAIT